MTEEGGCVFERDYHLQRVVCVCCRQQHSSPLCACVSDVSVCFQQYPSHQPREYYCVLCVSVLGCVTFLCQAAGSTTIEQDGCLAG